MRVWAGGRARARSYRVGGYTPMADVTIVVRKAALNGVAVPPVDSTISYTSAPDDEEIALKVRNITPIRGVIYVLDCDHDSQGA
jgi:hypothetical protein